MKIATLDFQSFGAGVLDYAAPAVAARAAKAAEQAAPAAPEVTSEQIEQTRREAYQNGFEQGCAEERRKIERERQTLDEAKLLVLQSVASGLANMTKHYADTVQHVSTIVPELVMSISRKVVGQELKHAPLPSIIQTVQQCLQRLMNQPHIMVHVHPELMQDVETEVQQLAKQAGFAGKIGVEADDNLAVEDCRIEWKNGMIQRSVEEMLTQVESLLKQQRTALRSNFAIKTYDELKETIE